MSVASARLLLAALLVVPTIANAQQRIINIKPGASSAVREAFVREAERAPKPGPSTRYIIMYREQGTPTLRAEDPLPTVSRGTRAAVEQRIMRARGVRQVRRIGELPLGVVEADDPEAITALLEDRNIAGIEIDQLHDLMATPSVPTSTTSATPMDTEPYGLGLVGAQLAWANGARGQGIKVGVLDSGGDSDHPDLLWAGGYDAVTGSTAPSAWDDNIDVCNGHGTHVAGTIAARNNGVGVVGVAPEAELYAVKVFESIGGRCSAWTSVQLSGLNWLGQQGVQVANASLGGSSSNPFYGNTLVTLRNQGMVLTASSGNSGASTISCPACYNASLAIGSVGSSKARSSFSQYGYGLQWMAPGEGVLSTMPGGGTGSKSGTSMAAPHTAGVLALVLSSRPGMPLQEAIERVTSTIEDLNTPGWDLQTGFGLVRADRAIGALTPQPWTVTWSPSGVLRHTSTVGSGTYTGPDYLALSANGDGVTSVGYYITTQSGTYMTGIFGTQADPYYGAHNLRVTISPSIATLPAGTYVDTLYIRRADNNTVVAAIPRELIISPLGGTPITATLTPSSRYVSVRADPLAPASNTSLTLSGTGASTTTWRAASSGRVIVPTTPSGTGSQTIAWNRAPQITPGLYIDTLRVTVNAPTGELVRTVIDSMLVRAIPTTTALTLEPTQRTRTMFVGQSITDSVAVLFTGGGAETQPWTAVGSAGITVTRASGSGSGYITFTRTAATEGTSNAVITVRSDDLSATYTDIANASIALALAVEPTQRTRSMLVGQTITDSVAITISGTGAGSATWGATASSGITLLRTGGTGSGYIAFQRTALTEGTSNATIVVTSGDASTTYTDIANATVALAVTVDPTQRARSMVVGETVTDSVAITITGTGAVTQPWTAVGSAGITVTRASGTGSGYVTFTRTATTEGTSNATIVVTAGALSATYTDVATIGLPSQTVTITPARRSYRVDIGTVITDSANVTLGRPAAWEATAGRPWTSVLTTTGANDGVVRWQSDFRSRAPGLFIDTVRVTSEGVTGFVEIAVTAIYPTPTLTLSRMSGSASVVAGTATTSDSVEVRATAGGLPLTWSVDSVVGPLTVTPMNGQGIQQVRWTRSSAALTAGTYVSRIVFLAPQQTGVSTPMRVAYVDTLTITDAPTYTAVFVPTGQRRDVTPATLETWSEAALRIDGPAADTIAWRVVGAGAQMELADTVGRGPFTLRFRWRGPLDAGVHSGKIRVELTTATAPRTEFVDTLVVADTPPPGNVVLRVSPTTLTTYSYGGDRLRTTREILVEPLGAAAVTARWRVRPASPPKAVSVATNWRTGTLTVPFTVSHGNATPGGLYVDTLIVERLDALNEPILVVHTLDVQVGGETDLVFTPPSQRMSFAPGFPLATAVRTQVRFTITPMPNEPTPKWSSSATRGVILNPKWRSGKGTEGVVELARNTIPTTLGWHVDTLTIHTLGRAYYFVDSLLVEPTPAPVLSPLSFTHDVTSRYWTAPEGTTGTRRVRFTVTPTGPGADTLLWKTTVRAADPAHTFTGAGSSRGPRSILVNIEWGLPAGIHVDTIMTRYFHDQRIGTDVLDTLEIVAAMPASMLQSSELPLIAVPRLPTGSAPPLVLGRGIRFMAPDSPTGTWLLFAPEAPLGRSSITVIGAPRPELEDEAHVHELPIYRVATRPTLRTLVAILAGETRDPIVAGWADTLGDGDGTFTLADVVRLRERLNP